MEVLDLRPGLCLSSDCISLGDQASVAAGASKQGSCSSPEFPPALQIDSTDSHRLLEWSSAKLDGPATLPSELRNVEFRSAAAVALVGHKAVLLKMKNEQRASLLIVDACLAQPNGFHTMHEKSGSASLWSDGRRTYVLLFNGNDQEMRAYMTKMGINA
jgi:hypothetical protein